VTWAYRQRPLATALLVLLITPALAATLDTGNITFLVRHGHLAAHFVDRAGGFLWAPGRSAEVVPPSSS